MNSIRQDMETSLGGLREYMLGWERYLQYKITLTFSDSAYKDFKRKVNSPRC